MRLREYQPGDQVACLAILASNLEQHFAPGDDALFQRFLEKIPGWHGVVESNTGEIVGCGGIAVAGASADLTWGMVHASSQGQGYGRFLLLERLRMLRELPEVRVVHMNTSQTVLGFYLKHGFKVIKHQPNGYREGLDRFDLELRLTSSNHREENLATDETRIRKELNCHSSYPCFICVSSVAKSSSLCLCG